MAAFSEEDCLLISQFPLEPTVGPLRGDLEAAIKSAQNEVEQRDESPNPLNDSNSNEQSKSNADDELDIALSLLTALQSHRIARKLRPKESNDTVMGGLAALVSRIASNRISINDLPGLIFPLANAVIQEASDVVIWNLVLQLISSTLKPTTPPASVSVIAQATFGGTPKTYTSASHLGSEQSKDLLYDALRDEFRGCAWIKVLGFIEKYFDNKSWTPKAKEIYESVKDTHSGGRWIHFPREPTEAAVWKWLSDFQHNHMKGMRGVYCSTGKKNEMSGLDSEGQLDLFVKSHEDAAGPHNWASIRVIGEHMSSGENSRAKKFIQLSRYARNIFAAQPRRQFVHGFILASTKMELHVFDRSGTFCAEPFDLYQAPELFIRVIVGYCAMDDNELGLDTFVKRDGANDVVTITNQVSGKPQTLRLETQPIFRLPAIVGRNTSCYPILDNKGVVKFSWVPDRRSPTEAELLMMANERGVKGIPRLIGYSRVTSTGELRSSLTFSKRRQLQGRQPSHLGLGSLNESGSGRKRKSSDTWKPAGGPDKKSRSDSQASPTSPTMDEPFVDRVLLCQATQPAGRPLADHISLMEFLQALRDAIKVHRSLFFTGRMLHRDISESNVVITNPDKNDGFFGMLIDLELATTIEHGRNARTGSQRMTGTLKYMAIEVLEMAFCENRRDLQHTYRYDLESFFYVFLAICVRYGWEKGQAPNEDPFRSWYIGSYEDLVRAKLGDMTLNGFETVLTKFSPRFKSVKPLAVKLRDVLFLREAKLRTGTPEEDASVLYDQTINAFDEAIEGLNGHA
ncbi:hypothetical protein VM1G_05061 [Cytospora mali]|uniref:EKC/KEOPS complex subunit BUD32 n=1 Tax=Cytospora mali TaxID=578113 RepID=A0A194VZA2_CYTMA|nr:hypothetical protein VM1G_05061 [Valsa mali]